VDTRDSLKKRRDGPKNCSCVFFFRRNPKKGGYLLFQRLVAVVRRAEGGKRRNDRSIHFLRSRLFVTSFSTFPFSTLAVQNNGLAFSCPAEKIFLSVAKNLARPARIHGAMVGTVMEGSIVKKYLVEFIGFCFATLTP